LRILKRASKRIETWLIDSGRYRNAHDFHHRIEQTAVLAECVERPLFRMALGRRVLDRPAREMMEPPGVPIFFRRAA
jgi:hypothetical protein